MRISFVVGSIVVGLLVSASPGHARYGFCQAQIPGRNTPIPNQYNTAYPSYLSEILDFGVGEEHSRALGRQFSASVGQPQGATCFSHFADADAAIYYKAQLLQKQAGYHVETGWNGGFAAAAPVKHATVKTETEITRQSEPDLPKRAPAAPKYVEVAGPNGTQRLSPEVAARNQAAADEYRRKMEEFAAAKAEHERTLALHQRSQANAAAEQRTYQQKLAMNNAEVAAHGAAMDQHKAATKAPAKGAKGWMYCDARGAPGDKRRFYSRVVEVDYVPGQISIIDVMGRNRPSFKTYVAGSHSVYFATDSLVHCPYSTTSQADAEALMARDKRGDNTNDYQIIQTGWAPSS